MAIVCNYIFLKNSRKIIVNKKGIQFGKKHYLWDESLEIRITGKGTGFINSYYEATKISFKNQDVIYIHDDYYSNASEIKSFIYQVVINKNETFKPETIFLSNRNLSFENLKDFKGHPVFSFRGIAMWALIVFFVFLLFNSRNIRLTSIIFTGVFCIFWFLLNSWMTHYFKASNKYFVIKNHYFFWIEKIYLLEDIQEIVYERHGKQSNALRLITKDFRSKRFLAGTLRDKKWLEMKTYLEDKNIKVRNECI